MLWAPESRSDAPHAPPYVDVVGMYRLVLADVPQQHVVVAEDEAVAVLVKLDGV